MSVCVSTLTYTDSMKVRDCDEGDLIARFVNVLPQGERTIVGSGDDCALISCPEPSFLVLSLIHI